MAPEDMMKPAVSEELVISMVQRLYGLRVQSVKEMDSYEDRNFHIKVSDDHCNPNIEKIPQDGYTLKIVNPTKCKLSGQLDSMHHAILHLSKKGLKVPTPMKNLQGNTWTYEELPVIHNATGREHEDICGVHLLKYLPGVPISSLEYNQNLLEQWGRLLANFHNAAEDLSNNFFIDKTWFWDLKHVPEVGNYMDGLEQSYKVLTLDVLDHYTKDILPALPSLKKGITHGDLNDNNIIVNTIDGKYIVDGVLDLEDVSYGTYAWDVGLMLAYVTIRCENIDPIDGMQATLMGYLQLRTLTDHELSLMKVFSACRLCQSLVLGAYISRQQPENKYILDTAATGWSCLRRIWETPSELLLEKWRSARRN